MPLRRKRTAIPKHPGSVSRVAWLYVFCVTQQREPVIWLWRTRSSRIYIGPMFVLF